MLTFQQRLIRYLIGIFIGLLIVYAIFGGRDLLGWTPENRVLYQLRTSKMVMTPQAKCELKCSELSDAAVLQMLIQGEVLFDESQTKQIPRIYTLRGKSLPYVRMAFETADSVATLLSVRVDGIDCSCD